MSDITFQIIKHIGVIREGNKGWRGELNVVSWNNNAPKFDIRDWNEDHTKMSRGLTFTKKEAAILADLIKGSLANDHN